MSTDRSIIAKLPKSSLTSLTDFQSDHQSKLMLSGDIDAENTFDELLAYLPVYSATSSSKHSHEPSDENHNGPRLQQIHSS